MKKRLLFVCPALLLTASAWGATCGGTSSNPVALSTYTASGFSCTSANGDFLFSDFYFAPDTVTGKPPASDVGVVFVDDGTNEGFTFTGDFSSVGGGTADANIKYDVVTAGADAGMALITGNTVSLGSSSSSGGGEAKIVEGLCTTKPSSTNVCTSPYSLEVYNSSSSTSNPPEVQTASVTFGSATTMDYMNKNIMLSGEAGISEFTNTVQVAGGGGSTGGSPVPEPGSTVLIGSGLIVASLAIRKKIGRTV